jgi:hypothetical protein
MRTRSSCVRRRRVIGVSVVLLVCSTACAGDGATSSGDATSLFGADREASVVEHLSAGPVRLKFQDGELRYLYVGNREIVRRIYFAVRDRHWDTVMPTFEQIKIRQTGKSFTIHLEAVCKSAAADYAWTGEIHGDASGEITFTAKGLPKSDFRSPRIGFCVLYGARDLAGREYEVVEAGGDVRKGVFPQEVSPALLQKPFRSLRYTVPDGMQVRVGLEAGDFSMEDQRTYGDSSYKAYAPMEYSYPQIQANQEAQQMLRVSVSDPVGQAETDGPVRIALGDAVAGRTMPRIVRAVTRERRPGFGAINRRREQHAGAESLGWSYCPALHLPDDDTFMENLPAIVDQVRTVRSFAPDAAIRIGPIGINAPYPRSGPDPRNRGLFAGAWTLGLTRYLALSGVEEAAFGMGPGPVDGIIKALAEDSGRPVLEIQLQGARPVQVQALALGGDDDGALWLANTSSSPREVAVDPSGRALTPSARFGAPLEAWVAKREEGIVRFTLEPFEVCRLSLTGSRP